MSNGETDRLLAKCPFRRTGGPLVHHECAPLNIVYVVCDHCGARGPWLPATVINAKALAMDGWGYDPRECKVDDLKERIDHLPLSWGPFSVRNE